MTHTGKETKLANIYFFIWKKLSAAEKEKKELASTYVSYQKKNSLRTVNKASYISTSICDLWNILFLNLTKSTVIYVAIWSAEGNPLQYCIV